MHHLDLTALAEASCIDGKLGFSCWNLWRSPGCLTEKFDDVLKAHKHIIAYIIAMYIAIKVETKSNFNFKINLMNVH